MYAKVALDCNAEQNDDTQASVDVIAKAPPRPFVAEQWLNWERETVSAVESTLRTTAPSPDVVVTFVTVTFTIFTLDAVDAYNSAPPAEDVKLATTTLRKTTLPETDCRNPAVQPLMTMSRMTRDDVPHTCLRII